MRIVLVRHGQTPSNVAGLLDTAAPGPGLTELGERQAAAIPQAFQSRPVDLIAVSNLVRTSLTAAPLVRDRGLTPMMLEGLREIEAGDLEMASDAADLRRYGMTVFEWVRGDAGLRMPGGETGVEFFERFDEAIASIAHTGAEAAVTVSHGAAIRAWCAKRVRGINEALLQSTTMPNTGFAVVEGNPVKGWDLVEWSTHPAGGAELMPDTSHDPTAASAAVLAEEN